MHYLGVFPGIPAETLAQARAAGAGIESPPVEIVLDRVESFSGHRARRPLVLAGEAAGPLAALDAASVAGKRHPRFTPHVTLLYDEHRLARQAVAPIAWTAREFALVRSLLGQ
ncbi:2'-5' RNA ligase [Candidatus Paraburkholderia kirkii]|nr:2'-5' RNA ligase [Candidatus Paraburkholderia kirkii]